MFSERELTILVDALSYMYRDKWADMRESDDVAWRATLFAECEEINALQHRVVEILKPGT